MQHWQEHQQGVVADVIQSGNNLELGIDGQCDSPGHNATYCTVTAMDAKANKIVDLKVVNVKEVKNSQGKNCLYVKDFFILFSLYVSDVYLLRRLSSSSPSFLFRVLKTGCI